MKLIVIPKKRRISSVALTIMDLPRVIMMEILSKLPIKSVFSCKCVCKPWYYLPSDPLFAKLYQTKSSAFPCILLTVRKYVPSILELKYAHYDYHSEPQNRPFMICPTTVKRKWKLIGSCNGFVCLLNGRTYDRHSIFISNPLLGEYFKLQLPERVRGVSPVAYGFCFNEGSGQYKILRLVTRTLEGQTELEVYTLGVDKKWRNVGEAPKPPCDSFGDANVNGSLHWLDARNLGDIVRIYSFDVGMEVVKSLPPPPGLDTEPPGLDTESSRFTLTESIWNCLVLTKTNVRNFQFDIWCMKEYGIAESWTKCYRIDLLGSFTHHLVGYYKPILIWNDGEILMQNEVNKSLVSYNHKEKQCTKVSIGGDGRTATRYVPSFYSLKTVMGDIF